MAAWTASRRRDGTSPKRRIKGGLALLLVAFFVFHCGSILAQQSPSGPPRVYDIPRPVQIPVAPLGYLPPGELPAYSYYSLVNLRFVDANHLLFVFNTTGLLRRDDRCSKSDSERLVRAVVLEISSGKVEKQAEWKLYDFSEFLWPLSDGRFLLRRCSQLDEFGSSLHLRPLIRVEGSLEDVGFSPDRTVMVLEEKKESSAAAASGSAAVSRSSDRSGQPPTQEIGVEFIRLHPPEVIVRSVIPLPGVIPLVKQGILETLTARHNRWDVLLHPFQGPQRHIVSIHSYCEPALQPITNDVFVATVCPNPDYRMYVGYDMQGTLLWKIMVPPDETIPRLVLFRNGARFALETIQMKGFVAPTAVVTSEDVAGQDIHLYDTHSGVQIASLRITPAYTAGRNVDISPDGTRIAILNHGTIEIFTLDELARQDRTASR